MTIQIEITTSNGNKNIRAIHNVIEECLLELRKKGQLEFIEDELELKTQWGDLCTIEVYPHE